MTMLGWCGKLRGGEVAEWTNAAVSKTVMSAAPASGVQIPPSPLFSSQLSANAVDSRAGQDSVSLLPLTASNWKECAALSVGDSQRGFLPEGLSSIVEAQLYDGARLRAVYAGGGMVGFVLYGRDVAGGSWKVYRFMVDRAYPGRGHGRAAVISELADLRECSEVLVSYQRDNAVARSLYAGLGFEERSCEGGKATAFLDLPPFAGAFSGMRFAFEAFLADG